MNPFLAQVPLSLEQVRAMWLNDIASVTNHVADMAAAAPDTSPWYSFTFWMHHVQIIVSGIVALLLFMSWYTVGQQYVGVVERFGKYRRSVKAGLHFKLPLIESVDRLSLMTEQHEVTFRTITQDKVSVTVKATLQYKVIPGREYDAYYLLDDPAEQLEKFFSDIMRSQVPVLTLDELFAVKDTISQAATTELEKDMTPYGYVVARVLITSVLPAEAVVNAMNDINAAQRESQAAVARGDASKTMVIKAAEAQAEADRLRGVGLANQRIEITRGYQKSVEEMHKAAPKTEESEILSILMMSQYFEMLEKMAVSGKSTTIFLPHSPGGMGSVRDEVMQAMIATKEKVEK